MNIRSLVLTLAAVASLWAVAWADTEIKFARGTHAWSGKGAIVRGSVAKYWVKAARGQAIHVWVTSAEKNAVFQVIGDGGALSPTEQKDWRGKLPINGDYLIEMSSQRGNATFTLNVDIQ